MSTLKPSALDLYRKTHQTIKKVSTDIEREYHFNTAIAGMMELVNEITSFESGSEEDKAVFRFAIEQLLLLLSPFSPHIAEELWMELGNKDSLADMHWPAYDKAVAAEEEITIVIQVNGKVRSRIVVPADEEGEEIKKKALADDKTGQFIKGKKIIREVYVPKKLVNIVVQE